MDSDHPPELRRRVERASGPALLWLSARPAFVLPGLIVVLLVAGLATPPAVGVVLLALLLVVVGWLCFLSWPALLTAQKALRLATLGLLAAALAGRTGQ